jgi:hypothetical protein
VLVAPTRLAANRFAQGGWFLPCEWKMCKRKNHNRTQVAPNLGEWARMGNELKVVEREFNGIRIQKRDDGFWNATQICKANGKLWADYFRLKGTESFLDDLSTAMGIPIAVLVQSKEGGDSQEQGTWVHERVAIHLAGWCSSKFAVLMNGWVHELLTKGRVELQPAQPKSDVDRLLDQARIQYETLLAIRDNEQRIAQVENRIEKIEAARAEAQVEMLALPAPQLTAPEKSLRMCLVEYVRGHCMAKNVKFQDAWNNLYRETRSRTGSDLKAKARNRDKQALDIAEEEDLIGVMYAIAAVIFSPQADGRPV